jgi:hypothetical protein
MKLWTGGRWSMIALVVVVGAAVAGIAYASIPDAPPGGEHPGTSTGFYMDPLGVVHLKGTALGGGLGPNDPIFFLPAGYRPSKTIGLIVLRDSGLALVVIDQDGRVFQNLGVATDSIAFDGLSFRTDEG